MLEAHSVMAVRHWIDQLVAQGFLLKDGEYATLSLTDAGRQVFRGELHSQTFAGGRGGKANGAVRGRGSIGNRGKAWIANCSSELRGLRTAIAAERGVPAYVVFSDASLRDMARRRPSNLDTFLDVHGVGQQKCSDFGAAFVAAIGEYCQTTGTLADVIPIAPVGEVRYDAAEESGGVKASSIGAFAFFREGASIDTVAKKMNRARSTVIGYLSDFLRHETVMDPSPWVEPALVRRIEAAIEEAGYERLKPIFDQLGGEVSYDDIKIVAACIANRAEAL